MGDNNSNNNTSLKFDWGRLAKDPKVENKLQNAVNDNPALRDKAANVNINGGAHLEKKDGKEEKVISGTIMEESRKKITGTKIKDAIVEFSRTSLKPFKWIN